MTKTKFKGACIFLLLTCALLSFNFSCKNRSEDASEPGIKYSKTQKHLFQVLDNYSSEYFAEHRPDARDTIERKYKKKLALLLQDTLRRVIDSMTVTVDTVVQQGWLVTTEFHTQAIAFKYRMRFQSNMPPKVDSFYHFMKNLQPGKEVTVNFDILGDVVFSRPDEIIMLRIFACPFPCTSRSL